LLVALHTGFVFQNKLEQLPFPVCPLLAGDLHSVRLAYQPPANSTFLSEQTSQQQPASSTFLSEQISTSHQPSAARDD
jgi:hypothetical protein